MRIATVKQGLRRSYLFGPDGAGSLVAIDPGPDTDAPIAAARGRPIERVIVTSGFGDLPGLKAVLDATGAELLAHRALCQHLRGAGIESVVALSGGAAFDVDGVPYRILACPGVDPFAIAVLVASTYLFTGETLLVGGVGRLDGAGANPQGLFMSLRILSGLPGGTQLLAGRDLGSGVRSTLGEQKLQNPAFAAERLADLVALASALDRAGPGGAAPGGAALDDAQTHDGVTPQSPPPASDPSLN